MKKSTFLTILCILLHFFLFAQMKYKKHKITALSLGTSYSLNHVKQNNVYKAGESPVGIYRNVTSVKSYPTISLSYCRLPSEKKRINFTPEFNILYYQDDIRYSYIDYTKDFFQEGEWYELKGKHRDIYTGFSLNGSYFVDKKNTMYIESGFSFLSVFIGTHEDNLDFIYTNPPGDVSSWTKTKLVGTERLYIIPYRLGLKTGVGKMIKIRYKNKILVKTNFDIPLIQKPMKLGFRQSFIQLNIGYIFK